MSAASELQDMLVRVETAMHREGIEGWKISHVINTLIYGEPASPDSHHTSAEERTLRLQQAVAQAKAHERALDELQSKLRAAGEAYAYTAALAVRDAAMDLVQQLRDDLGDNDPDVVQGTVIADDDQERWPLPPGVAIYDYRKPEEVTGSRHSLPGGGTGELARYADAKRNLARSLCETSTLVGPSPLGDVATAAAQVLETPTVGDMLPAWAQSGVFMMGGVSALAAQMLAGASGFRKDDRCGPACYYTPSGQAVHVRPGCRC